MRQLIDVGSAVAVHSRSPSFSSGFFGDVASRLTSLHFTWLHAGRRSAGRPLRTLTSSGPPPQPPLAAWDPPVKFVLTFTKIGHRADRKKLGRHEWILLLIYFMPNPLLHLSLYFIRFVLSICQLLLLIVCLALPFGDLSSYHVKYLTFGILCLFLNVSHGWRLLYLYLAVSKSNSVDLYRPPALRNNSNNNNSSSEEAAAVNEAITTPLAAGTATTASTSPTSKESPNR